MRLRERFATMLILMAACVCLSAAVARAQVVSRGAFTLQHEAQWGKYTLPKGDYNYTIRDMGMKGAELVAIRAASSSQQFQMMGLERTPAASIKGTDNAVIITTGANGNSLRGIYLAGSNVEYVFPVYASRGTVVAENPKPEREVTPRLPIRKAAK